MNMNKREAVLALVVALIVGGWALMSWVVKPAMAAFDEVGEEAAVLEQDLAKARALVDAEAKIRRQWLGYERAGLSRSLEQADAQTGAALFVWAEDAGFDKVNLSDGKAKIDDEQPFGELSYTLQTTGSLREIYNLLWSVRESPFPLRMDKCVIDLQRGEGVQLQISLTVSTLFNPEVKAK